MSHILRNTLVFLIICAAYGASYQTLRSYRAGRAEANLQPVSSLLLLPPVVMNMLAGEFKGLASDFMLFDIAARLGTEIRGREGEWTIVRKVQDWDVIHKLFVNCQTLDPYFKQTFVLAQGWLPWEADLVDETGEMLKVAAEKRFWDWEPLRFLGFNSYYFYDDWGTAGTMYLQAAKVPDSPPFLLILGARLAQKGGRTETAILLMREMLENTSHTGLDYQSVLDRLHSLEGALVIERGVQVYVRQFSALPESPDQLVQAGIIAEIPMNPDKVPYCIDREGTVYFDRPDCREKQP